MAPLLSSEARAGIKVIGVGGAGCNAVTHMILAGLPHVEFIAVDTDPVSLADCRAPVKIYIGEQLNKESGANGDPDVARSSAEKSAEELQDTLYGADIVFIVAGMGGNTGSGAAPVVARLAWELDAGTVGVITKPFNFEGTRRRRIADTAAQAFKEAADMLIAVPNDRLPALADKKMTMSRAFTVADDLMGAAVQSISGTFTAPGIVTPSFSEARRLLRTGGYTAIGFGRASGEDRAAAAAMQALQSPFLEGVLARADKVLFTFAGSSYTSAEVAQAAVKVMAATRDGNSTWMGTRVAAGLEGDIEVLVMATVNQSGLQPRWGIRQPRSRPPQSGPGGPSPFEQRVRRRPPMNPSAGSAEAPLPEPMPPEIEVIGSITVPWLRPDRPSQGGAHPR